MNEKIFITGSNGYIGKHLVDFFLKKKFQVFGCDINLIKKDKRFIRSDFTDDNVIRFINLKKIDHIFHLAALTEINNSKNYIIKCRQTNYLKSKIFIKKIYKNKIFIKNFIFSSSAAVYGITENIRIKEKSKTLPISEYGKSKLNFEKYLIGNKKKFINNIFICRFFNVIGGNLLKTKKKKSIFNYIHRAIKNKKFFFINGKNHKTLDGTTVRDYIDIEILSKFIYSLIKKNKKNIKQIYNVGSGVGISILEILNYLNNNNFKIKYSFRDKKKGDIPFSISDNSLMLKQLKIKNKDLRIINNLKKFLK